MGLPFAAVTYFYTLHMPEAERTSFKSMLIWWGGMPASVLVAGLTMGVETAIMYALGFSNSDLSFYTPRLLIGESVGCLVWAKCLLVGLSTRPRMRSSPYFSKVFVGLLSSLVVGHILATLAYRTSGERSYSLFVSVLVTLASALTVILKQTHESRIR
jgi:hypothetical protein